MLGLPVTFSVEQFDELVTVIRDGFQSLVTVLQEGFVRMSEQSEALVAAFNSFMAQFDIFAASFHAEIQQITDALAAASDTDLRAAAADVVTRLGTMQAQVEALNMTAQGIIPDTPPVTP